MNSQNGPPPGWYSSNGSSSASAASTAQNQPQVSSGGANGYPAAQAGSAPAQQWTPEAGNHQVTPGTDVPFTPPGHETGWSIVIATYPGEGGREAALQFTLQLETVIGLHGAWVQTTGDGSLVRYGQYDSFNTADAQKDLTKIKGIVLNGQTPFAKVFLARNNFQAAVQKSHHPEFDLANLRVRYPNLAPGTPIYSLQIGVYIPEEHFTLADARATAEKAVVELRAKGQQAYFYHGSGESIVTVGVFFKDDVNPQTGAYSAAVRTLQEQFKYNLFNGRTINETLKVKNGSIPLDPQPSFLVNVP